MTRYKLALQIEPLPEGGYLVTSPEVPGLLTEGDLHAPRRTPASRHENRPGAAGPLSLVGRGPG